MRGVRMYNNGSFLKFLTLIFLGGLVVGCGPVDIPGAHTTDIPAAASPREKMKGVNESYDGITRVRLDEDVLVPRAMNTDPLPDIYIGPYELRSETLAGALQLILADFDISLAFETQKGLTKRVTVANLQGRLPDVVDRLCGLANLYCGYENGMLTIKDFETFVVDLPPFGDDAAFGQIVAGLENVLDTASDGGTDSDDDDDNNDDSDTDSETLAPVIDTSTRVIVYRATNRTARQAERYFERIRKNTALIVFETHVWEVTLDNANRTGINWTGLLENLGNFEIDFDLPGGSPGGGAAPMTITPSFNGSNDLTSSAVLEFISEHGAVKTVSQPQLTVLSGSEATLTIQNTDNYVSQVSRTVDDNGDSTFATETATLETGLDLSIQSAWDESTVYGTVDISLEDLLSLDDFPTGDGGSVQLPSTASRSLQTQIRVRPGDAILIAGMVSE
ncbi:MAG: type II secretion system protein GspD, partial [Pseudomonadota bacterium]